jgi:uroporphyrinogen decarboxylase
MTPKERIRAALRHEATDVIPTHFSATGYVWEMLKEHFGTEDRESILQALCIDTRVIAPRYIGSRNGQRNLEGRDFESEGIFGEWKQHRWCEKEYNSVCVSHPLNEAETVDDIDRHAWPTVDDFDYSDIKQQVEANRDMAFIFGHWGPFQTTTNLRSNDKLYMDMALNPDFAMHLFDRMHQFQIEHYTRIFEAGEGMIDILRTHDDYGTQRGLLFGTDMWRQYFKKNTKALADLAHSYGAFFIQHSCGAVRSIIPELIDCGVDGLEPIQPVEGMDPESLGADFGGKICFMGGIDTQQLLPLGTPEEVYAETQRYIKHLSPGGYILYPSQAFESDVPVKNILALYRARTEMSDR